MAIADASLTISDADLTKGLDTLIGSGNQPLTPAQAQLVAQTGEYAALGTAWTS